MGKCLANCVQSRKPQAHAVAPMGWLTLDNFQRSRRRGVIQTSEDELGAGNAALCKGLLEVA
jgi:hypothetical protein